MSVLSSFDRYKTGEKSLQIDIEPSDAVGKPTRQGTARTSVSKLSVCAIKCIQVSVCRAHRSYGRRISPSRPCLRFQAALYRVALQRAGPLGSVMQVLGSWGFQG